MKRRLHRVDLALPPPQHSSQGFCLHAPALRPARHLSDHPPPGARMGPRRLDLLDIVDAAYKVDGSNTEWLQVLAHAARPHLDQGFGVAVFEYLKPEGAQPQIVQRFHLGIPDELDAIYHTVFD